MQEGFAEAKGLSSALNREGDCDMDMWARLLEGQELENVYQQHGRSKLGAESFELLEIVNLLYGRKGYFRNPVQWPKVVTTKCASKLLPFSLKQERRGLLGRHTEERGVCRKPGFKASTGDREHPGKEGQLLWVPPCDLSGLPYWYTTSSLEEVIRCTHGLHTPHRPVTKLWAETKTSTIPEPSEKAISQPIGWQPSNPLNPTSLFKHLVKTVTLPLERGWSSLVRNGLILWFILSFWLVILSPALFLGAHFLHLHNPSGLGTSMQQRLSQTMADFGLKWKEFLIFILYDTTSWICLPDDLQSLICYSFSMPGYIMYVVFTSACFLLCLVTGAWEGCVGGCLIFVGNTKQPFGTSSGAF